MEKTHQKVAAHYERFPYPQYPLWISGRWQQLEAVDLENWQIEGVIQHAWIAGCGSVAPLMFGLRNPRIAFEASDLSRKSLQKLRIRLILQGVRNVRLHHEDLLQHKELQSYDAIDCYGVLHHTSDPQSSLKTIIQKLRPGGVLRLMLYSKDETAKYEELRQLALKMNSVSPQELRRLMNHHGFSKMTREDDSSIADTFLNPIVHSYDEKQLRSLTSLPGIQILDIQKKKNWLCYLKKTRI